MRTETTAATDAPSKRKSILFAAVTLVLVSVFGVLCIEGFYALAHFSKPRPSATYWLWSSLMKNISPVVMGDTSTLRDVSQITPFIAAFKANGVGLGNSPFQELKTDLASTKNTVNGCQEMKPNLVKTMGFLRSELFNSFDPLNYFYDSDRKLPDEVVGFLDRYKFGEVRLSTNAVGERLTFPAIDLPDKVLVAGDSMGMSLMLDDRDTLASQLQAADRERQYVNIGIGGADAISIVCALDRAAKRYTGQIRSVVYMFTENDFVKGEPKPFQRPKELISRLAEYKKANNIQEFTLVYNALVYNTVPELTRVAGHREQDYPRHEAEKAELLALAKEAGFRVLDYGDIVRAEQENGGSLYSGLALYVDECHLSRLGVARLVAKLTGPNTIIGTAPSP